MPRPCGRILIVALTAVALYGCATRRARPVADIGIPICAIGAERDLLSADALQCWFTASHGAWRTLNHQSHLEALVVDVEARDLRDAIEIAERVVADPMASAFTEILVYVARPQDGELRIRRVGWTSASGYDTLEFSSPISDSPLTVRSSPGKSGSEPHPTP